MSDLANNEKLLTAFDAHVRADLRVSGGDMSAEAVKGLVRTQSVLFDAALACGMPFDEPCITDWTGLRIGQFLTA
jgi:hypothetical protein